MIKIMHWRQLIPNLFTVMAMLAGFISILMTIQGMIVSSDDLHLTNELSNELFRLSAKLIMLSMILDGIDGNVARLLKGQSEFGAELDTYVDLTAFGIAPAILVFAVTFEHHDLMWRVMLPSAVALSGMVRLARFKASDPLRGQGGYAGLPITANAGWVALFVFITQSPPHHKFSLQQGGVAILFLVGVLSFIILQVTSLRYPKPTKKATLFIPCIILVALLFCPIKDLPVRVAVVMLLMGLGYAIFGPLFVKGIEVHKARKEAKRTDNDSITE